MFYGKSTALVIYHTETIMQSANNILTGECNTIVSAYTLYRHLQ